MIKRLNTKGYVLKTLAILLLAFMMAPVVASAQVGSVEDEMRADMIRIAEAYANHVWRASDVGPPENADGNIETPIGNTVLMKTLIVKAVG